MGLSENLTEIKSEIDALLTFANGKTGVNDTALGDAVRTLADKMGSDGSGGTLVKQGVIIPNNTTSYAIDLGFKPMFFWCCVKTNPDVSTIGAMVGWLSSVNISVLPNGNRGLKTFVTRKGTSGSYSYTGETATNVFLTYSETGVTIKTNSATYPIREVEYEYVAIGVNETATPTEEKGISVTVKTDGTMSLGYMSFFGNWEQLTLDSSSATSIASGTLSNVNFPDSDGVKIKYVLPNSFNSFTADVLRSPKHVKEIEFVGMGNHTASGTPNRWVYQVDATLEKVTGFNLDKISGDGTNGSLSDSSGKRYAVYFEGTLQRNATFANLSGLDDDSIDRFIDHMMDNANGLKLTLINATVKSRFSTTERLARIEEKGWILA